MTFGDGIKFTMTPNLSRLFFVLQFSPHLFQYTQVLKKDLRKFREKHLELEVASWSLAGIFESNNYITHNIVKPLAREFSFLNFSTQSFPTFLTLGALFKINFYGGAPCLPYVLQVNGV